MNTLQTRKVILSVPGETAQTLVIANLTAVAVGTLRVLAWAMTLTVIITVSLIVGMMQAAHTSRRRRS